MPGNLPKVVCGTCQYCQAGHGTCASCDQGYCGYTAQGGTSGCGTVCDNAGWCNGAGKCMACIAGQVTGPPKGGVIDGITVSLSGVGTTVSKWGGWAIFCGTCSDGSACNTEPALPFCEGDGSRCSGIEVGSTHTFTYKCPLNNNWYATWPSGAKTVTQACYWYDGYNCNCGISGCGSLIIKSTNCRLK